MHPLGLNSIINFEWLWYSAMVSVTMISFVYEGWGLWVKENALTVQPWLACNSLCKLAWPWTHRASASVGIKGLCCHTWPSICFFIFHLFEIRSLVYNCIKDAWPQGFTYFISLPKEKEEHKPSHKTSDLLSVLPARHVWVHRDQSRKHRT